MLALERHRAILELLNEQGGARVADLALRFDVTEETIRRDLDKLEADGKLVRSHGGAVVAREREAPHWQREYVNTQEKDAIAREASKLVVEGDTILLDASSSSWFLAQRLPAVPLVVITNSLYIALALGERPHCKVISPGGTLAPVSMSFVGSETQAMLRRYHARRVFLSCRGFDAQRGASDVSEEQAMVRRVMMEIADECNLLVDGSKLGQRALSIIAPPTAFRRIITDGHADPEMCRAIEQTGLPLIRADVFPGDASSR
jgi:DeoR/GlpR family transcriptional regulator of sugar metabolism